ncbi:phospholipid carrier-dependent glycosyltransferase [Candidatus Woesearchaeota archaeon]|nr:phospholipid carrier-dependent glycosyltransferase [Candidatus Woesearchaeota archaeon]
MDKKIFWLLFVLVIAGFSLRIFLTDCYYWDELVYLQHAEILSSNKADNYNELEFRPPMLPVMISGAYIFWHNPLIGNVLVVVMASVSVLLIYLAGKEIFDQKTGLIAAVLLAFWPLHIYFSKTLLVHTTAMFFALLFLFFLKKGENKGNEWFFCLAGVFIGSAILTRFTYLILIPVAGIDFLLFRKRYDLKKIIFGAAGFLAVILPYLSWAYIRFNDPLHTFKTASLIVSWSTRQPWYFYLENLWIFLGFTGVIGVCSWIFFRFKDKKINKEEILLWSWILLPFIYLSFKLMHKEVRFLIVALAPVILISAYGVKRILERIKNKTLVFILLIVVILPLSLFFAYDPYVRTCDSNAQKASEWIMNNSNKEDVIYAQHEFPALAYYTNRKIVLAPFDKKRFFNKTMNHMKKQGYYVYFEEQKNKDRFPKTEEIENDERFKLVKKIEDENEVYIYKIIS